MFDSPSFHWPILGHGPIKQYLQACLQEEQLSHAYLFYGPAHLGKFLTAHYFANSIICQGSGAKKPCRECESCEQLAKNVHADVTIVNELEGKENISISQIRELQHKLSLRSFLTKYKIAIIDGADALSEEAANALLKTLEEPTPKTMFILVATSKESLPTTIVSRCQLLQFSLVPSYQLENWLITRGYKQKDVTVAARLAAGKPGLAQQFLTEPGKLETYREQLTDLFGLIAANLNRRFQLIGALTSGSEPSAQRRYVAEVLDAWLSVFRDVLLVKNGAAARLTNLTFKAKITQLAHRYSSTHLQQVIQNIFTLRKLLTQSINPKLLLENLALTI